VFFSMIVLAIPQAHAETIAKAGRFGGITIRYKIVLPNAYDPARAYPAILAFAGGRQNLDAVNNMLERNWLLDAQARGYIVVSPIAPANRFIFEPDQGHGIQTLAGEGAHRLFDQIEQAARGCS